MAYRPQVLTVEDGGTGAITLTNHGVLIGSGTSAITPISTGSAGQVLQSGGASSDPAYSTATYPSTSGSSGNVLTSDGTNFVSSAPSSGDWVKIESQTASSSPNIDFINLSSTYAAYVVMISNLSPATDQTTLWMRTSTNNGSSYDSGGTNYDWIVLNLTGTATAVTSNTANASKIELNAASTLGNGANEKASFRVTVFNPSANERTRIICEGHYLNATPATCLVHSGGSRNQATAVNAIRFLMSSGNIASGRFDLYGIKA